MSFRAACGRGSFLLQAARLTALFRSVFPFFSPLLCVPAFRPLSSPFSKNRRIFGKAIFPAFCPPENLSAGHGRGFVLSNISVFVWFYPHSFF